jgi:hypothetical protein
MTVLTKAVRVLLVAMVLALGVLPLAVQADTPAPGAAPVYAGTPTYVMASKGLNLRQDPNLTGRIILGLRNGERVYPMAGPVWAQGISWTFVRVYRGAYHYDGFCATAYLGTYPGYVPTGEHGLKVTAPAGLRLRSGPGTNYAVYRIVPYGTIVQSTGVTQWAGGLQWSKVRIDGVYLWAASMYLQAV